MATKYQRAHPVKWPGVYQYEMNSRQHMGKPDACYVISYKVDGKKVWEKVGLKSEGYTPQVAAEIRADRVKKARHGEEVKTAKEIQRETAERNRTVCEIADAYFEARGAELKGLKTDKNRYEKHIRPVLGNVPVSRLSPLDMMRVRKAMDGKASATIFNALELVRRIVNFGSAAGLCPAIVFTIEMPRKDNEVVEYLEPEEAARFMEILNDWPRQDVSRMLKLAMFTGLRRGEIFKLTDKDIDFHQGFIVLRSPKGGKTCAVPLNGIARVIIEEQLAWRKEKRPDSLYVFPGQGDGPRTDCSAAKRIKDAANLPRRFRIFHGLRHHFAVTLANSGKFTLDMIGELLTHKNQAMTRRYGQYLPHTMKQAGDAAAELVRMQAEEGAPAKKENVRVKVGT